MHSGMEKGQIEMEGKVISLPVQACPTCGNGHGEKGNYEVLCCESKGSLSVEVEQDSHSSDQDFWLVVGLKRLWLR